MPLQGAADASATTDRECAESVPSSADEAPVAGLVKPPESMPLHNAADASATADREC